MGGLALSSPSAFGQASNGTTHSDPSTFGPVLTGPAPGPLSGNCPEFLSTPNWALAFVGGNSVSHGTINNNGDWGGGTAEGPAVLTDGTLIQYAGHLQEWGGGGQNSNPGGNPTNQSENGFTLNFNGSGIAGSISIHANMHMTTNNSGTPTANVTNISVTCS
jgi:hypothetical protein